MKRSFFQAAVVSIMLYGCTTWTLTKRLEKKLDGNYTRILRAILNKSRQQNPTRHQLYGHLPPITKTIKARRTRHAGHCWRSKDEIVSDVLLWTPAYGQSIGSESCWRILYTIYKVLYITVFETLFTVIPFIIHLHYIELDEPDMPDTAGEARTRS